MIACNARRLVTAANVDNPPLARQKQGRLVLFGEVFDQVTNLRSSSLGQQEQQKKVCIGDLKQLIRYEQYRWLPEYSTPALS